jgi:RNase H-fold protein (predicted Holliday junction resolvase)
MSETPNCALAIDPGTTKCGLAVVRSVGGAGDETRFEILHRGVASRTEAQNVMSELASRYSPDVILVGDGTMCKDYRQLAESLGIAPVRVVDEKFSTLRARKLYFEQNPPRGIRRLIPTSLQTPACPYDDYVAVILAQSFLSDAL